MKICFVGLGSIGKRHLNNILLIGKERNIDITIDALRSNHTAEKIKGITHEFYNINEMKEFYNIIFICNPTSKHLDVVKKIRHKGEFFFIEKPVFSHYISDMSCFEKEADKFYIACPLRYCGVMEYLKANIDFNEVISCRSICSTYLPSWRKDSDYRTIYSAHKDQGGGVIIDLIHELDYLIHLFGIPDKIFGFYGKFSKLEIDCEDLAIYIAKYKKMLVELHLDYFGRDRKREVELYTNDEIIIGDLDNNKIYLKKENIVIDLQEDVNARYIREIEHVLDIYEKKCKNNNNIILANEVLKIAQSIEED